MKDNEARFADELIRLLWEAHEATGAMLSGAAFVLRRKRKLAPQRAFCPGVYAIVRCECSGRVAKFSNGKLAVTYCKPIAVIKTLTIE